MDHDSFPYLALPPLRPGNPALCGSHPLVNPYYCRLGDLLCFVFARNNITSVLAYCWELKQRLFEGQNYTIVCPIVTRL